MSVQSSTLFSTLDLPVADQFEAYRAFMAPAVDVELVEDPRSGFATEHTVWNMGSTVMTRAVLPADRTRRFRHLSKEPLDHWCLVLCDPATPRRSRAGDPVRLTQRDMGIRSLGRSFETAVNDTTVLSLYIPRDLFSTSSEILDAAEDGFMPSGLTGLLADYLAALERRLPMIAVEDMGRIAEATGNIIAACLAPTAERLEAARPAANWTLVERARRAIQQNLHSPEFSPDDLCRAIGTSRSKLYRLFEPFGGVAHYIQRQRLREARSLLARPNNALSVSRIGERVGFTDLSSFSRAFRREFGMSPSEARRPHYERRASGLLMPEPAPNPIANENLLGTALRSLHG